MKLLLLDYGSGNLHSVLRALGAVAPKTMSVHLSSRPDEMKDAARIVLPGVCAFRSAMAGLEAAGLKEPLQEAVRGRGVPFLGICAGMQLMAEEGEEMGTHQGLGWIPGAAKPLAATRKASEGVRIPHMGWNNLVIKGAHPLFQDLRDPNFYFAHSYSLETRGSEYILAQSDHGGLFNAAVARENMAGVQFHPEKSQGAGLKFLENFCKWAI